MAMRLSKQIDYTFYGSGEPMDGIAHADTAIFGRFVLAPFRRYGRFLWQTEAVRAAVSGKYDAIIFLGDPNFVSTWAGAMIARFRRTPVLFWAHGWLRTESRSKRQVRNLFFLMADYMLVYAERGKQLGNDAGYPETRIKVVYNSLDVNRADAIVEKIEGGVLRTVRPQEFFEDLELPLLICTARLTSLCRFDLLIDAAAMLKTLGRPVNVLLVGDGPERAALEIQAKKSGVALHCFGACYDEELIGQLIYYADVTVSPGKIGLTAMHSLMYGTPAITHDNLDQQMPEVEAIVPERTGLLFTHGDAGALAGAIDRWLSQAPDRTTVRAEARAVIHAKWNPTRQAEIIEQAVLELTGGE